MNDRAARDTIAAAKTEQGRDQAAAVWPVNVGVAKRLADPARWDRIAPWCLLAAVLAYFAAVLWLTRGSTFTVDELRYFGETRGFDPEAILSPFGGHLQAAIRVFYAISLELFGPAHLPMQVLTGVSAALVAVLLYLLVSVRVGALPALAAAILVLFLGLTPTVLQGSLVIWSQAVAAGLAALLVLERRGRLAAPLACVLLIVAVASIEVGLGFALAAATWLLLEDRGSPRRLWVALLPIALYAAWWLWAQRFDDSITTTSNLLLAPAYGADLLAGAMAALSGLGLDLEHGVELARLDLGWGRVIVPIFAALIGFGFCRRRSVTPLAAAAAVLIAFLVLIDALAYGPLRYPDAARYAYPVAVGMLVLLAAAFTGSRPSARGLVVLAALLAIALPANLWAMRERGAAVRSASDATRVRLAMIELERDHVDPAYREPIRIPVDAGDYLAAADRYGSPALPIDSVAAEPEALRVAADETLAAVLGPRLEPVADGVRRCSAATAELVVPAAGLVLSVPGGGEVLLRRFADQPGIKAGTVGPGAAARIVLPADASTRPWVASAPGSGGLRACGR